MWPIEASQPTLQTVRGEADREGCSGCDACAAVASLELPRLLLPAPL